MSQEMNPSDSLHEFEKGKLPSSINILTILTIIGSIIGLISSVYTFFTAKKSYETMKETIDSGKLDDAPKWAKGFMSPEMLEMTKKMFENKLPIMVLSIVAMALCLYGAMEMRKLKKQGYTLWLIGELLPLVTTLLFIGMAAFSGFGLLAVLIPIIFIILYTVNRKHLVN
ncbi:MAG: hypothetical protein KBF74_05960 [Ferruginibacter sp.]|nr:hypothetical protein [Ferruginibacter sp.]